MAEWREEDRPRDDYGGFTNGSGMKNASHADDENVVDETTDFSSVTNEE